MKKIFLFLFLFVISLNLLSQSRVVLEDTSQPFGHLSNQKELKIGVTNTKRSDICILFRDGIIIKRSMGNDSSVLWFGYQNKEGYYSVFINRIDTNIWAIGGQWLIDDQNEYLDASVSIKGQKNHNHDGYIYPLISKRKLMKADYLKLNIKNKEKYIIISYMFIYNESHPILEMCPHTNPYEKEHISLKNLHYIFKDVQKEDVITFTEIKIQNIETGEIIEIDELNLIIQ